MFELIHKDGNKRFFMTDDFGIVAVDFDDPIRRWYVLNGDYKIIRHQFLMSPVNNNYLNEELNKLYPNIKRRECLT